MVVLTYQPISMPTHCAQERGSTRCVRMNHVDHSSLASPVYQVQRLEPAPNGPSSHCAIQGLHDSSAVARVTRVKRSRVARTNLRKTCLAEDSHLRSMVIISTTALQQQSVAIWTGKHLTCLTGGPTQEAVLTSVGFKLGGHAFCAARRYKTPSSIGEGLDPRPAFNSASRHWSPQSNPRELARALRTAGARSFTHETPG
ncbi:hypothetical protein AC579_3346 [Pseudocercospora musae]|uniref:Uncharacterized protein n=1 Tax=Pseudocercospora musae TaxID=113226 RepID=A0A139IEK7_9PEZI|nr:hypothetical protein AC579_3346 [Pseudocercospora musae]